VISRRILPRLLLLGLPLLGMPVSGRTEDPAPRLTLPPVVYAVPGVETGLYFDNVVLSQDARAFRFRVEGGLGTAEPARWSFTPKISDVGDHRLRVTVQNAAGQPLQEARTTLRVMPAAAGKGRKITLLMIGDSLTHASLYPNEVARLLSEPGNPEWEMLGTHHPASAAPKVSHEGYGGWTWQRFVQRYAPQAPATGSGRSSPFVYPGKDGGAPVLDVARYLDEQCGEKRPDFVTIMLGINDCFGLNPEDPAAIDAGITATFTHAETLLAAIRKAAPQAQIGLCLTTPPNSREGAFVANYKERYHRWGWRRIQHRLVERQLQQFGRREQERIYVIPTELNLDPVGGYPENNAVHPNASGYQQIGATIYAWLKSRL
jgi:lysophospholipase L1-like esterase